MWRSSTRTGAASRARPPFPAWSGKSKKATRAPASACPPYGDITQDQLKEMNENLHADQLEESKRRSFDFYLRNYASTTWRYGLRPYEMDWNVEDRLK